MCPLVALRSAKDWDAGQQFRADLHPEDKHETAQHSTALSNPVLRWRNWHAHVCTPGSITICMYHKAWFTFAYVQLQHDCKAWQKELQWDDQSTMIHVSQVWQSSKWTSLSDDMYYDWLYHQGVCHVSSVLYSPLGWFIKVKVIIHIKHIIHLYVWPITRD